MLRVDFDNTTLDGSDILKCTITSKLFGENFKLGSTVCKEVKLWVAKSAVSSHPSVVKIWDTNSSASPTNLQLCTLFVDNVDDTNDYYYDYTLLDGMVKFNKVYTWDDANPTMQNLLNDLLSDYGLNSVNIGAIGAKNVSWVTDSGISAREYIGFVAEVLGGYAHMTSTGQLEFVSFTNTVSDTIALVDCSSFKLGESHTIERVVYDNLVHYEYPVPDPLNPITGDTLYINPDNILFSDDGGVSDIDGMVQSIYNSINGFSFYNIEVDECPINIRAVEAGNTISIGGYSTIAELDCSYGGQWGGGYKLGLQTGLQEETSVIGTEESRLYNSINITLNRQQGIIDLMGESIDELEENSIHFQVDAVKSEVRVTNQDTFEPTSYTSFKEDGMRIYVEDEMVAEATANRFECHEGLGVQDWVIEHGENAEVLMIYRRS